MEMAQYKRLSGRPFAVISLSYTYLDYDLIQSGLKINGKQRRKLKRQQYVCRKQCIVGEPYEAREPMGQSDTRERRYVISENGLITKPSVREEGNHLKDTIEHSACMQAEHASKVGPRSYGSF